MFTSAEAARVAITAGNATFTICSKTTGKHLTFKAKKAKRSGKIWVSVLTGPDNEADFEFIGGLDPETGMVRGRGFEGPRRALNWINARIFGEGRLPETATVHHEGRCCKCGRKLTTPESIESGIGPVCAGKL